MWRREFYSSGRLWAGKNGLLLTLRIYRYCASSVPFMRFFQLKISGLCAAPPSSVRSFTALAVLEISRPRSIAEKYFSDRYEYSDVFVDLIKTFYSVNTVLPRKITALGRVSYVIFCAFHSLEMLYNKNS